MTLVALLGDFVALLVLSAWCCRRRARVRNERGLDASSLVFALVTMSLARKLSRSSEDPC